MPLAGPVFHATAEAEGKLGAGRVSPHYWETNHAKHPTASASGRRSLLS